MIARKPPCKWDNRVVECLLEKKRISEFDSVRSVYRKEHIETFDLVSPQGMWDASCKNDKWIIFNIIPSTVPKPLISLMLISDQQGDHACQCQWWNHQDHLSSCPQCSWGE